MKTILLLSLFTFSINAAAGLYLEPYHLKSVESFSQAKEKRNPSEVNDEYDLTGTVFGAKLGWSWGNKFIGGFEYAQSKSDWDLVAPDAVKTSLATLGSSQTDRFEATHYGVFAANRLKNWIMTISAFYTVYEDTNDKSLIPMGDKLEGYTYGVGLKYPILGFLGIGIEWRSSTLKKYTDKSTGNSYSLPNELFGTGEYRTQEFYLSLSLPLTLGKK